MKNTEVREAGAVVDIWELEAEDDQEPLDDGVGLEDEEVVRRRDEAAEERVRSEQRRRVLTASERSRQRISIQSKYDFFY